MSRIGEAVKFLMRHNGHIYVPCFILFTVAVFFGDSSFELLFGANTHNLFDFYPALERIDSTLRRDNKDAFFNTYILNKTIRFMFLYNIRQVVVLYNAFMLDNPVKSDTIPMSNVWIFVQGSACLIIECVCKVMNWKNISQKTPLCLFFPMNVYFLTV
ncbi:hypothetical protein VCUG_02551 [Vavraia culicis subsp. floridensis]|uniref:Uncharacterized protein n=1 Tax=Vavraia culicis (isolate floridensis) TaxID=948595 RepID=L2GQN9_VAVCU|nr:uncharacterized protein VCUG_02551 [Vavraia culicis subsp. floridensis]ELA45961.1 hypothetical protein VCUG_02551 [Vavraia culicis subsp. floridensis]